MHNLSAGIALAPSLRHTFEHVALVSHRVVKDCPHDTQTLKNTLQNLLGASLRLMDGVNPLAHLHALALQALLQYIAFDFEATQNTPQ
ncbi:MAG: hypothetical protein JJD98_02755 [Polaromonas sp.]|nr:hypothetical protein [Polaromonas sp.]